MTGNLTRRRMVKFMPAEFKLTETRQPPLKELYDEWLARFICYAFSAPASAFITQVNRATSQTLRTQAATEGLAPLKAWVKMALDRVIALGFRVPDLEFCWVGDDGVDPLEQAQTIAILVNAGVKTVAEARAELGLGQSKGVLKGNPYHDEAGQFTDADHAVEPGAAEPKAQGRGSRDAEDQHRPPLLDVRYRPPSAADHVIRNHLHEAPGDAVTFKSGDGHTFLAPPSANFARVFAAGETDGLLGASHNVGWWGTFDFQREGDTFIHPYTNASNYAVGAYLAGAGCPWPEALFIANSFAHSMSSNAGSQDQVDWWLRGWSDATNKTGPFSK
jgi:hypothetical protein